MPGNASPLVLLVMGKDHKLFYEAYNDASDIDDDGLIDTNYKHSITYYGYFDPFKCYSHDGSKFVPQSASSDKYCNGSTWSGNILNWMTMSRLDVIRKVLYGGYRSIDTNTQTVLEATYIPRDAHSWGKELDSTKINNLSKLIPSNYVTSSSGQRTLVCVASLGENQNRKLRILTNKTNRIWEWVSKERPVCDNSLGTPIDLDIKVKVCKDGLLEENCKKYPAGNYKPIGILQKYGEGDGTKVCSNNFQICSLDSDCSNNGKCIYRSDIFFGLITGSYDKNISGGVLRKNIGSIYDEINSSTGQFTTVNGIINTLNKIKIVGFSYSNYSYSGGWIANRPIIEGEFKSWGNPIGEMLYEGLRYFADKGLATSNYNVTSTTGTDSSLGLPYNLTWNKPYSLFPKCSKPFIVVVSDINVSFDSDQLPGSYFSSFSGDLPMLNVSNIAADISSTEGINNTNILTGQSGNTYDSLCTSKSVSGLGSIRGLCPEEPTKQGSYYAASVAYYGHKKFKEQTSKPSNISFYTIAASDYVANLSFKIGGKDVKFVPIGKSVSGCLNITTNCYNKCTTNNTSDGLKITNCSSDSFCPTNQIVDYYIENISYKPNGDLDNATFRINFEDVEQGADHDMDAIVRYTLTNNNGSLKIDVSSEYAAGCVDQVLGFNISGTDVDGIYLVVKDKDVPNTAPANIKNLPLRWSKTFSVSGNSAGLLKSPLYYVAKWGNFDDYDKTNKPDKPEKWDKDNDGMPDAYFEAFNGTKLADSFEKVMKNILNVSGSGTGVALLTERTSSASIAMQGVYSAKKEFENQKSLSWIGNVYGWWTYAYAGTDNETKINIREDTNSDKKLNLLDDYILTYRYENESGIVKLLIDRSQDIDGDGNSDNLISTSSSFDDVKPIWDSGLLLLTTDPSLRKIITHTYDGSSFNTTSSYDFNIANKSKFSTLLGIAEKDDLINYIRGVDKAGWRNRTVTYKNQTGTWKIGDIIHSKPFLVKYDKSSIFSEYNVLLVGANDGMLHAIRVGRTKDIKDLETKDISKLCDDKNTESCNHDNIGKEIWAFIPRNIIPYLKYLKDPTYCHTYFVDLPPYLIDEGDKKILIGGLRLGGGCKCMNNEGDDVCKAALSNGKSSYFAIDISDPNNPTPLWEFSDDDMGFSYSGPAYIKRPEGKYIMFGNGPTHYKGKSTKNLKFFILRLKSDFRIDTVIKTSNSQLNLNNSFSGKLFTEGIDVNNDGYTDFVAVGYVDTNSTNSQGGVVVIQTNGNDPSNWVYKKNYLNLAQNAITSKIVSGDCFGKPYIFFGSGRHFYMGDNEGTPGNNDENYIWGIPFGCTIENGCVGSINSAHSITLTDNPCEALQDNSTDINAKTSGWKFSLNKTNDPVGFLREKLIVDPVLYKNQVVLFTTTQYFSDPCTMEAKSKIWMLNCATGRSVNTNPTTNPVCSGYEVTEKPLGIAVDTSGGMSALDITKVDSNTGYYTSPVGIVDITVDENLGIGNINRKGRILFWIEK